MSTNKRSGISFFRPKGAAMGAEVRVISLILVAWLVVVAAPQFFAWWLSGSPLGRLVDQYTLFHLPVTFWITGQLLPLCFVFLCVIFNFWMDRNISRNLDQSLRFRIRPSGKGEL